MLPTQPTYIRLTEFLTCNYFILFTVPQVPNLPYMVSVIIIIITVEVS